MAPPELINKTIPFVKALNKDGYHTTYAMDERRFNQIDESYGFKSTAGPKIGAADAFISSFSDFPYINVLLNHPYSDVIFPYLNNNRAYGKSYSPSAFNKETIYKLNPNKANFLSVHFCQLHWPYTSSDFIEQDSTKWKGNYSHFMYKSMLTKVDKQIENFFEDLKRLNYLNNSIVYVISDHGEGFKLGENLNTLGTAASPSLQSWGHGTNVLDQKQTKVLLARVQFKNSKAINKPGIIDGLFSLVDILPTINKELNLKLPVTFDGIPLPNKESNVVKERFVFVESSLPSKAMNASFIDEKKVVSEVGKNYVVRSSGEAVMKPSDYISLLARKQRSVYYRDYQLALLPKLSSLVFMDFTNNSVRVIEDEENDLQIHKMLMSLCLFYKGDFGFDKMNRCANLSTEVNDNAQQVSRNN
ncbi:hypothetical protein TUM4261_09970 [Shewanella sp. c952]|nr:hypothetical protein TUM4261_09970 [Shewanella sp. c952]